MTEALIVFGILLATAGSLISTPLLTFITLNYIFGNKQESFLLRALFVTGGITLIGFAILIITHL